MREIKDYLHLYLQSGIGCFIFPDDSITDGFLEKHKTRYPNGEYAPKLHIGTYERFLKDGYKPILRPLSDMTEEEMEQIWHADEPKSILQMEYKDGRVRKVALCSERTKFLLSKGFDIFGLIEAGLAIDKTTLK